MTNHSNINNNKYDKVYKNFIYYYNPKKFFLIYMINIYQMIMVMINIYELLNYYIVFYMLTMIKL